MSNDIAALRDKLASMPKMADHYCDARTWSQASSGTWAGSHSSNGCQRAAKGQVEDEFGNLHWACGQHMKNLPKNGWN